MPGIKAVFDRGPLTYSATTVANGGNIKGGQLVEPDGTTGRIKPATADTTSCLGVATGDTTGSDYAIADSTDTWGNVIANMNALVPNEVAVAYQGVWRLKVASGGAVSFGALVACAANGEVKALGAGAANTVIGRCVLSLIHI